MKFLSTWLCIGLFWGLTREPAQAQTNFRPVYVLLLSGDTLRGNIDLRDSRANSQQCQFRANATAATVTYSPAQLRGYGFVTIQKHYRALTVSIASASPHLVFLEVLVDGPATLYFLRNEKRQEALYIVSSTLPLTALAHALVPVVRNGNSYIEEQTGFRSTLTTAFAGCPQAQNQLPKLPYQENAIKRVIGLYNACQGYHVSREPAVADRSRVAFGLSAGVSHNTLSYEGGPYEEEVVVGRQVGFAAGPQVRFNLSQLSRKLSLIMAVLYQPEKYELVNTGLHNGSPANVRTRCRCDMTYLRLPVMVRYTYPRGKVSPVAEAGFSVAYALKAHRTVEQAYYTADYSAPQPLMRGNDFRPLQVGLGAGLGLSIRALGGRTAALLCRADLTNGMNGTALIGTSVVHVYGLLSIDFTK